MIQMPHVTPQTSNLIVCMLPTFDRNIFKGFVFLKRWIVETSEKPVTPEEVEREGRASRCWV